MAATGSYSAGVDEPLSMKDVSNPALMRSARGTYANSIRAHLSRIGVDDLPKNGSMVLLGIASDGGPRADLPSTLGVSKQAVSQLLETLVNRGFLERGVDLSDRRRISLELTDKGRRVAEACAQAVDAVDRQLDERLSTEQVAAMRAGLEALSEIKVSDVERGRGEPTRVRQFRRFSPVLPVRDLETSLRHYESLGFKRTHYEPGGYGFVWRDGMDLHLCVEEDLDPSTNRTSVYLYVRDADALYREWNNSGAGDTRAPSDTPWEMREGTHTDPDGNIIRYGSNIEKE
jgi:DNA-binding MarR family transcriptional regulator/predicted enzyme related to lactoylglutathione lyase